MSTSATSFRTHAATLRLRAPVLALTAALGLAAATGYVLLEPEPLTSTALVLLPTAAISEASSSDVPTQVRIATSAGILQRAGDKVNPKLSAARVEKLVEVTAPTDQLIQISATSQKAAVAQDVAQALADTYVNYVRDTAREVTQAAVADLSNRRDDLQAQLGNVRKEIAATTTRQRAADPNSVDGRREAQSLTQLRIFESSLALQLERVQDRIATGTPVGSAASGTLVIQPATPADGLSMTVRLLIWGPLGALAGALLGVAVVVARARRDPRIRMLDEIADAVGCPVLAAIESRPQRSVSGWATLLETYKATETESWALRQLLRGLSPGKGQPRLPGRLDYPRTLTVVSLSGDGRGLAIGPQLAAFAASLGIKTRLVPTIGHTRAPELWACSTDHAPLARKNLQLSPVADGDDTDLTIFVVVAERTLPYLKNTPNSVATIVAVAAGTATEQELARVAVAVDDAGRRIDAIVVADPDQTDRTSGRHTILERSRWPDLPNRLTGVGPATDPMPEPHRTQS